MKRLVALSVLVWLVGCSANPERFDMAPKEEQAEEAEPKGPTPEEVAAKELAEKTEALKARKMEQAEALDDRAEVLGFSASEVQTRIRRLKADIEQISPATEEELLTADFEIEQRITEIRAEVDRLEAARTTPPTNTTPPPAGNGMPSPSSTGGF